MGLTTTDENRCGTIAMTGGTATLLLAELLTGAGNVTALTRRTGGATCLFALPGDDAVQDVCTRI